MMDRNESAERIESLVGAYLSHEASKVDGHALLTRARAMRRKRLRQKAIAIAFAAAAAIAVTFGFLSRGARERRPDPRELLRPIVSTGADISDSIQTFGDCAASIAIPSALALDAAEIVPVRTDAGSELTHFQLTFGEDIRTIGSRFRRMASAALDSAGIVL